MSKIITLHVGEHISLEAGPRSTWEIELGEPMPGRLYLRATGPHTHNVSLMRGSAKRLELGRSVVEVVEVWQSAIKLRIDAPEGVAIVPGGGPAPDEVSMRISVPPELRRRLYDAPAELRAEAEAAAAAAIRETLDGHDPPSRK